MCCSVWRDAGRNGLTLSTPLEQPAILRNAITHALVEASRDLMSVHASKHADAAEHADMLPLRVGYRLYRKPREGHECHV